MKELKNRVAVITGAANGMGRGMAERFVAEGMKVVMSDIDAGELDKAATEIKKAAGGKAEILTVKTDVTVAAEVKALADAAMERFGAVHVLCNNAGIGGYLSIEATSLTTWKWNIDVMLWGPIYGTHYFLPILAKQDEAHIVNTGSLACVLHAPYNIPYSVAKAGVLALSHGLYQECKKHHPNIGVTLLMPGPIDTSIVNDERHAPPGHVLRSEVEPELQAKRKVLHESLAAGKTSEYVADIVVDAIRTGRFYLYTHAEMMGLVQHAIEPIFKSPVPLDLNNWSADK